MCDNMKYFCGVEGGSTASRLVLLNEKGQELASVEGQATNHILIGTDECFRRIKEMVDEAKVAANLAIDEPLDSLGLCLSGCQTDEMCETMALNLKQKYPQVSRKCVFANDIIGSMMTSPYDGGVVLIAGTGSNSVVFNPDGNVFTCGGWGHLFGDEGSGYWIAWRAYKTLLDDNDNYATSPHDTKRLRQVICAHFELDDERSIETFYVLNDKKRFASLCKKLYESTKQSNDEAINHVFAQAGSMLARKVIALLPKANKSLLDGGLNIICVGSVFKSWDLLSSGFVQTLARKLPRFRLFTLTKSSALGAAKLAAKQLLDINGKQFNLPIGQTTELLYAYNSGIIKEFNGLSNGSSATNGTMRNGNGAQNGNVSSRNNEFSSSSSSQNNKSLSVIRNLCTIS